MQNVSTLRVISCVLGNEGVDFEIGDTERRMNSIGEVILPSWSWAGWTGSIKFTEPNLLPAVSCVRWIDYRTREIFTSEELRAPRNAYKTHWYRDQWLRKTDVQDWDYEPWRLFHERDKLSRLYIHPVAPAHTRKEHLLLHGVDKLCFEAMTCWLHITTDPCNFTHCDGYMFRCTSDYCKNNKLCHLEVTNSLSQLIGNVRVPESISFDLEAGTYEFVRLSRTRRCDDQRACPMSQDADGYGGLDPISPELEHASREGTPSPGKLSWVDQFECDPTVFDVTIPWCLYNVMLVRTVDGVSERIGLGQVHVDAFMQESPQWRTVLLG